MIEEKIIQKKLKPLNEKINEIQTVYGESLTKELIDRITLSINQFFNDFKNISSKSFNIYWKKIKDIDSQIDNKKITKVNTISS